MTHKKAPKFRHYFPQHSRAILPQVSPAPLLPSALAALPTLPSVPTHQRSHVTAISPCSDSNAPLAQLSPSSMRHTRPNSSIHTGQPVVGSGWRQRSQAAQERRRNENCAKLVRQHSSKTVRVDLPVAPKEFVKVSTNNTLMNNILGQAHPDANPDMTPRYDRYSLGPGTRLIIRYTGPTKRGFGPGHTRDLIRRFTDVIPAQSQAAILGAWQSLLLTKPVVHIGSKENHSTTPAFHFGIWNTCLSKPATTADTHAQPQRAKAATTFFINTIRIHVAPYIFKLMRVFYADQLIENAHVHRWPKYKRALVDHPECDFGAAFFHDRGEGRFK